MELSSISRNMPKHLAFKLQKNRIIIRMQKKSQIESRTFILNLTKLWGMKNPISNGILSAFRSGNLQEPAVREREIERKPLEYWSKRMPLEAAVGLNKQTLLLLRDRKDPSQLTPGHKLTKNLTRSGPRNAKIRTNLLFMYNFGSSCS